MVDTFEATHVALHYGSENASSTCCKQFSMAVAGVRSTCAATFAMVIL